MIEKKLISFEIIELCGYKHYFKTRVSRIKCCVLVMKHTKSNVQLHLNKFTRYNPLNVKERVRLQIPRNDFELEGN